MKKTILFLIIVTSSVFSCKNHLYNSALQRKGFFSDKIYLSKMANQNKEIVFIPMSHLGTKEFYKDVKFKIDSLKKNGLFPLLRIDQT